MASNTKNGSSHEQQERLNDLNRKYKKLKRRYEDKPFPERNAFFYFLALGFGWASNVLSAATEAAKVYVFIIGICSSVIFGNELSVFITILVLIGIELTHRGFARSYFKAWWKNGGHTPKQNSNLAGMVIIGLFSCFLSFTGGFDFLKVALDPPQQQKVDEISLQDINKAITPLVEKAENQANEYRETRLWRGRLSNKDATEWKKLIKKKEAREDSLLAVLTRLPYLNIEAKEKALEQFEQEQAIYKMEIQNKGFGLGFITIIAILTMYLCIWFEEKYLKKTEEYLELELNSVNISPNFTSSPTLSPSQNLENDLKDKIFHLENQINILRRKPVLVDIDDFKPDIPEIETEKSLLDVATHCNEEKEDIDDLYTILHYRFTDGKPVRLTQDRVNWYVKHYKSQLDKATELKEIDSIENFKNKLDYWQNKQKELEQKLRQVEKIDAEK